MSETKIDRQLVGCINPSSGFWQRPWNRALASWILPLFWQSRQSVFLVPETVRGLAATQCSDAIFSWDEVRNLATCHREEFSEVVAFHNSVSAVLAKEEKRQTGSDQITTAFRYPLSAGHAEGTPYFISGLIQLFSVHRINSVVIVGPEDLWTKMLASTALAQGIPVNYQKNLLSGLLGFFLRVDQTLARNKRHIRTLIQAMQIRRFKPVHSGGILICFDKPRALRWWLPVINSLKKKHNQIPFQIASLKPTKYPCSSGLVPSSISFQQWVGKLISSYFIYRSIWRRAKAELLALNDTFCGVKLAPLHTPEMADVWTDRAFVAATNASFAEQLITEAAPKVIAFNDPLENAAILSFAARKKNIPVFFLHPFFSGETTSAVLWEQALGSFIGTYSTLNHWQAARIVKKGFAAQENVHVVGDIVAGIVEEEARSSNHDAVKKKLGLDPTKPIICALTRPVCSALSPEEKAWILNECSNAAVALGAQFLVKGHPHEKQSELSRELSDAGGKGTVIISEISLGEVLGISDIVIGTPESTSNLDAIYAGVPLVLAGRQERFDLFDQNIRFAFRKFEACITVNYDQPIFPAIELLLHNAGQRELWREKAAAFVKAALGQQEKGAGELVAEILANITNTHAAKQHSAKR